jgi:Tol biopolymer transport system component
MLARVIRSLAAALPVMLSLGIASAHMIGRAYPTNEIAYVAFSNRVLVSDIFLYDATHRAHRNITRTPDAYESAPAWSPDGQHIAFQSDRDGAVSLYLMDHAGRGVRRLTDQPGTFPRWTRDGSQIVFNRGANDAFTLTLATGELMQVGGTGIQTTSQMLNVDLALDRGDMGGITAPDGSWIAFMRFANGAWGIYSARNRMRADAQLLAPLGRSYNEIPVWSPDSQRLAYVAVHERNTDVYVVTVRADGSPGAIQRVTHAPGLDVLPTWRPFPPAP